jgi:peptidoglycan/xylan/chitin deacetylase (PgdA/CDA1 family)
MLTYSQRMYDSGHQIASHTWGHPDLSGVDDEEFERQMYRNEMAIRNVLGIIPTYMRPPYISCDYNCAEKLDEMGYHNIYFDVDTVDYWNNDAELIHNSMDNVDAAIAARGEDPSQSSFLILQHDIHYHSVYSLTEYILMTMAEAGYGTSVTVGTCLGDPPRNWYRDAQPATVEC